MRSLRSLFNVWMVLIITVVLLAVTSAMFCFADDSPPALTAIAATAPQMLPAHVPAVTTQPAIATAQQLPQFQLPAQHDVMSIIIWFIAVLVPWLGWVLSEIMALIPGFKGNGVLHSVVEGLKALSSDTSDKSDGSDGVKRTVTIDLDQLAEAVKGKLTDPGAAPGAGA